MPVLQVLSLAFLALGSGLILRFIWLDSLRFSDRGLEAASDPAQLSSRTRERLALQAEADRVHSENERLPRAA